MNEMLRVTIYCENEKGRLDMYMVHCETMVNASRIILTFKPKRGYKAYKYEILETGVLV